MKSLKPRLATADARSVRPPEGAGFTYDRYRGSSHARGYDRAWSRLRNWHIKRFPLCAPCEARGAIVAATEVDHVEPIRLAPQRRLDPTNLMSLCHSCHVAKTIREG